MSTRWSLRQEVMAEVRADGGMDLLDPLFERLHRLAPDEVAALDAGDPAALTRLDTLHLRANAVTDTLRREAWYARMRSVAPPPEVDGRALGEVCAAVAALGWSAAWREPERWRRLVEDGLGGARRHRLDGLFPPEEARAYAAAAAEMPVAPIRTAVVTGQRAAVHRDGPLASLFARLDAPETRRALGVALGRGLDGPLHLNLWRLEPGEHMGVHPDGARYAATVAIGLNAGWAAADGGAIAFGTPGPEGLDVQARWWPHLGDVFVFAPDATTWHAVESPRRTRWTVSGWWMTP